MALPAKLLMPPHHVFRDFLDPVRKAELLDFALASRARYRPSTVGQGRVDPSRRISERLPELESVGEWFEQLIRERADELFDRAGVAPFAIEHVELEIAAHGDGAHFAAHTDIPVGWGRAPLGGDASGTQDRLVSLVYYFHRQPKAFTGGELRLHRFGSLGQEGDTIDVAPDDNSLVVFPSWVVHEVSMVHCPGNAFEDHRFAINCWLCRRLPSTVQAREPRTP